jgi:hypothetical protein
VAEDSLWLGRSVLINLLSHRLGLQLDYPLLPPFARDTLSITQPAPISNGVHAFAGHMRDLFSLKKRWVDARWLLVQCHEDSAGFSAPSRGMCKKNHFLPGRPDMSDVFFAVCTREIQRCLQVEEASVIYLYA